MNFDELRKLQVCETEILRNVVEIMDKLEIKYYLSSGTLLGAVRHKGFIPWDDDIDLMLSRQDFEKFIELVPQYLPEHYRLLHYSQTYNQDIRSDMERQMIVNAVPAIQIQDTRYEVTKLQYSKEYQHNVWIDIYALDEVPDGKIKELIYKTRLKFLWCFVEIHNLEYKSLNHNSRTRKGDFALKINNKLHIGRLFNPVKLSRKIDRVLKKNAGKGYKRLINFMGEYKFKEVIDAEFLGEGAYLEFEGMMLRAPKDYDSYLRAIYNDYMQLPKEEDRVCKHILKINLGNEMNISE